MQAAVYRVGDVLIAQASGCSAPPKREMFHSEYESALDRVTAALGEAVFELNEMQRDRGSLGADRDAMLARHEALLAEVTS